MALRPEQAKALIAKVMGTRDQEMTCDECVADLAEFVEVQLTGKPLSDSLAGGARASGAGVTIVPTSTTSCVRRLPPSLRKRDDDLRRRQTLVVTSRGACDQRPPMVVKQHLQSSRQNSQPSKQIDRSFLSLGSKPFRLKLSRCCYNRHSAQRP